MSVDKSKFYQTAAKRFAASTVLYKVDSLVHVEDEDDIWFWQQMLAKYRPGKYKFLAGSKNENNTHTTGCIQWLKYKDFLSQRFFICIDSDLRYLLGENISAETGVLQTYAYSWENHCCFAEKLQEDFSRLTGRGESFDFREFLRGYSGLLYRPFLLMLFCERNALAAFDRTHFSNLISLQYRKGDEQDNGKPLLERLRSEITEIIDEIEPTVNIDWEEEQRKCELNGVSPDNLYLYVRGHSLYNLLISFGDRLCARSGVDFEHNILKSSLAFNRYEAIEKIGEDIVIINSIRKSN